MKTHAQIIDDLGGYAKVAIALKAPEGTVASWKSRNSIPSRYWQNVIDLARGRKISGVTLSALTTRNAEVT